MKCKNKKVIIVLDIIILMLISLCTYTLVKAASATVSVSFGALQSDPSLYCRQGGAPLVDTFDASKNGLYADIPCSDDHYTRVYDKKTGEYLYSYWDGYEHANDNHKAVGKSVSNQYTTSERTIHVGSDTVDQTRVGHNFWLGGGYNSQAQSWAWGHSGIVSSVLGVGWSDNEGRNASASYCSAIDTFAEKNKAKISRGKSMSTENPIITENYKIGPFSVEYNQKIEGTEAGSGWISAVEVYDVDGKKIDDKYISLIDGSGKEIESKQAKFEDGKERTIIDLGSNEKFYVINKSEQEAKNVKVQTKKLAVEYTFQTIIYTGSKATITVEGKEYRLQSAPQNLFKKLGSSVSYKETTDEIEFKVKVKKGNLQLEKIGNYSEDGEDIVESLAGIKFKVYCEEPINKWVQSVTSTKITWTSDVNEAKEFKTNADGKVVIKNLYASQDADHADEYIYEYKVVECEVDKTKHPYYLDPIVINEASSNKEIDETVDITMKTGERAKYGIKGITAFYGETNNIKITDKRTSKDIIIEKDDYEHNELKLEGVEFKVKLVEAKYYNGNPYEKKRDLWLKNIPGENGSGVYDFKKLLSEDYLTANESEAGVFRTNAEGKINILCVIDGEYEIYETKSIDMYDIELQPGYYKDHKYRIGKTINEEDNKSDVVIHNEKTRGNLKVRKLGEYGEILDKVEFAVYCEETQYGEARNSTQKYSGWLTGKLDYTKVPWIDIGSIFEGDPKNPENRYKTVDGVFGITGLPEGRYTIYEVVNDEDYYDLECQEGYIPEEGLVKLGEYIVEANKENIAEVKDTLNEKTRGNLKVRKLGEYGQILDKVEFAVYCEETKYGEHRYSEQKYSGWLTGKLDYLDVDWKDIGSIFEGDPKNPENRYKTEEGVFGITGLPEGRYTIYEVVNDEDYYDLECQEGYIPEEGLVKLGEYIVEANKENIAEVKDTLNEKTRGNLKVRKVGENASILDKVEFAVYCEETQYGKHRYSEQKYSGWLTGKLDYLDVDWKDIGSIFEGNPKNSENRYKTVDGVFSITGLPEGRYTIYEIVSDEYYYDVEGQKNYIPEEGMVKLGEYTVVSNEDNTAEIKQFENSATRGNLELIKFLESGKKGASDVELEIFVEDKVTGASYWLGPVGDEIGSYNYTGVKYNSIPKNGGKFKVDNEGRLELTCIPIGTYYIYETRTHNIEYALEEQGEYVGNQRTLIKVVEVTKQVDDSKCDKVEIIQKERPQGDLEIVKKGYYSNDGQEVYEPLNGVSFRISSTAVDIGGLKTAEQKWVFINKNESGEDIIDFTDDINKATIFTTGEDGRIIIKNLYVDLGPYSLEETENSNPYYSDRIVVRGDLKDNVIFEGKTTTAEIINDRSSGDINIIKVDSEYSGKDSTKNTLKLEGAEFKVKILKGQYVDIPASGKWLKSINGYDYKDIDHDEYLVDFENAGTFVSDSNGEVNIKRVVNGTYEIWETKAPNGYALEKQEGYDPSLNMALVATIEVKTVNNNTVTIKIINAKTVIQLDGHVWEDIPGTKANVYNEIQDDGEPLLDGITVELYDKKKQKVIARTVTANGGYYEFKTKNVEGYEPENPSNTYSSPDTDPRINYWELANCYVRFIYDNIGLHDENGFIAEEKYGYVTVDPFVGQDVTINSKAKEYTINQDKLEEENLTGTTGNNPGIAITKPGPDNTDKYVNFTDYSEIQAYEGLSAQDKLLTGYYNSQDYTIHDINLGLKAKPTTDFSITEEVAYMKVQFGQYIYKYEYMSEEEQISNTVPTTNLQNSARTFTGAIYPSDVAYNKANTTDELKVYMVYRIAVQNSTTTNIANSYVEERMYLSSLTNEYDPRRYELSTDTSSVDIEEVKRDVGLWTQDGTNTVRFDVDNETNPYYDGIGQLETKTSYLQYRLTESSVEKILEKKLTEEDLVTAPSVSHATTFHEFFRNDNLWVQSNEKLYRDHRKENYEQKGDYLHKSWRQTRKTSDLWMRFDLPKEERQISGIVFEDSVVDESTEIGNGRKEDGENTTSEVLVELISAREDNKAVTLYQYAEEEAESYRKVPAVIKVETGGEYIFKGVVPGYYYIRFTYGDGTVKYKDLDNHEIEMPIKSKIDNIDQYVNTNDYKSTIITSDAVKEALKSSDDSKVEWYKQMDAENYSTAIDDETMRINNSSQTYTEQNMVNPEPVMDAFTAKTSITIENSDENVANITDVQYEDSEGNLHKTGEYYGYRGFNFGIVTMPKTHMELDKKIVNVDFTLQSGEQIVSANPVNNTSRYLSALDRISGGSKYAKVEIDPTYIYGSKVDVTYEVEVKNESTTFYTENSWSQYGEGGNTPARVVVTVKDLLDEKYDYDTVKLLSDVVTNSENQSADSRNKVSIDTKTEQTINEDGSTATTKCKEITGFDALATGEKETIRYKATTLLQTAIEDTSFINDAQIDSVTLDKNISLNATTIDPWDRNEIRETTTLVITPTFGEDRSNTNWIAITISLIVLASGIVLIKKKLTK